MTPELPQGTVTFLFTDIEGSASLYQTYPDAIARALARHHGLLRSSITAHRGRVFQIIGDAFCASFEDAVDGLNAMLEAQRAVYRENWGEIGALRVRMGLHSGTAETHAGEYVSSLTLVRVQRIMNAGHGGQMLLSHTTAEIVRAALPEGTTLRELGEHKLRGLAQPELIFQLVAADLPSEFPPLRAAEVADARDSTALLEQLVRGQLVGRGAELEQLRQHWELTQQARAHLVLLSGEPGVGKTRLATELVAHAKKEGAVVLRGGCYEYEATAPYLAFVEALRDWVHVSSPETLRANLDATAPEIARLAPELESKLGSIAPNPPLPPNEERLRLFDNVARLTQKLAGARGLLFFIDDLHWADQGTLNLLHYLLRHLRNERVLVLAAYREIELDRSHPLSSALVDWNREHLATRISLARLSRQDTGTLLATLFGQASISEEFVAVLYRETEGNPFFIEEVVKSLIEQGEIYRENGGWGRKQIDELAIPQSVKEAIGRRLNRLSEACLEVLRSAAALGKVFRFSELAAVVVTREDALLDALDEASAAQLISARAEDSFAFTHDKIREVLYEELNPIRRRRLHQRIGEKLEELSQTGPRARVQVQDLAYHFTQSGDLERALTYSRRAAENAGRLFALEEALGHFERAREVADALGLIETRAEVDEAIGDTYSLKGLTTPAVENYERALTVVSAPSRRGAIHAKIGRDYAQVGDARGEYFLEQALIELDPQTQANELALATAALGRYHHYHAQHHRALEFLQRALVLAEPGDDVSSLSYLYTYHAGAYQHLMRVNESLAWANRAIALGERKNHPTTTAFGYEFLGEDAQAQGRWRDALEYGKRDREIGERVGAQDRVAWAHYIYAMSFHGLGDLAQAEGFARRCLELGDTIGDERVSTMVQGVLAEVLADRGMPAEAFEYAKRSVARSNDLKHIVIQAQSAQAMGYVYTRQGDWQNASGWLEESNRLLAPTDNQLARLRLAPLHAEAHLHTGDPDGAVRIVYDTIALAQFSGAPHWEAWATRVKGQIFTFQSAFDDAERAYEYAIAVLTGTESRLELAWAYHHRAEMWKLRNQLESAQSDTKVALTLFTQCGAAPP